MGHVITKQSGLSLPDLATVTAIALVAYAAWKTSGAVIGTF